MTTVDTYREIDTCARCGARVLPMGDGRCPSCQKRFRPVGTPDEVLKADAADEPPPPPKRRRRWPSVLVVLIGLGVLYPAGQSVFSSYPNLKHDRHAANEARQKIFLRDFGASRGEIERANTQPEDLYQAIIYGGMADQADLQREHVATWILGGLAVVVGLVSLTRRRRVAGTAVVLLGAIALASTAYTRAGPSFGDMPTLKELGHKARL